jgi:hypothetical protein
LALREGDEVVATIEEEAIILKRRGGRMSAYLEALQLQKGKR